MSENDPLSISYIQSSRFASLPSGWRENALGYVTFANGSLSTERAGGPVVRINTPVLSKPGDVLEIWRGSGRVTEGRRGRVHYSYDRDLLFGCIAMSESDFHQPPGGAGASSPLQRATKMAFQEIFGLTDTLNYPYLLRIASYLPFINEESHGLERYRQFNIGRQEAFLASNRSVTGNPPAACALGVGVGDLTIYFVAGRSAPITIENPRQVNAYHYPPDYGPRSPTFSRATLSRVGNQQVLFVSGTSSIVGHRSMHVGDVAAQTRETLVNIEAVVDQANCLVTESPYEMEGMSYKVYVRHPEDMGSIHEELVRELGSQFRAIYLKGDICRQDLLVEIEALAGVPSETP